MAEFTEKVESTGLITEKAAAMVVSKDTRLMDPGARGEGRLVLRIKPNGSRTFSFRYSNKGVQAAIPIGPFAVNGAPGTYTVKTARAAAAIYRAMQKQHPDLKGHIKQVAKDKATSEKAARDAAERAAVAAALERERRITIRQLFERWVKTDLAPHVNAEGKRIGRKDGGEWVRQSFERRVFNSIGDTAVEDVRKADVMRILDGVKAEGALRTTNVLLADLKQMFAFAAEREVIPHSPIAGLKKKKFGGSDTKRERVLNEGEIRHLATQLPKAGMAPRSVLAIWFILATGCRVGEAMAARWEYINLEGRTWYLPDTKNQRDHLIHLSEFAIEQVRALLALREAPMLRKGKNIPQETEEARKGSPWLFPATSGTEQLDTKTLQKQLADRQRIGESRLSNRTKRKDILVMVGGRWTAHDLRRSAATIMAGLGIGADTINECLNHKLGGIGGVYIKDRRLPQQKQAFEALGAKLSELTSGRAAKSNVVSLQAKAA